MNREINQILQEEQEEEQEREEEEEQEEEQEREEQEVFFTHSAGTAADGQWPELERLICPANKQDSRSSRNAAVADSI